MFGLFGLGYCPPGCSNSCCRKVIICQPGCTRSCCVVKRIVCPPGCMLSCCASSYTCPLGCRKACCYPYQPLNYAPQLNAPPLIIKTFNTQISSYQSPQQMFQAKPNIQVQQFSDNQPSSQLQLLEQQRLADQIKLDKEKADIEKKERQLKDAIQQQRIERLRIEQQKQEQKKLSEQLGLEKRRLQIEQASHEQLRLEVNKSKQRAVVYPDLDFENNKISNKYNNIAASQISTTTQSNPQSNQFPNEPQSLFQGNVYRLVTGNWKEIQGAKLSCIQFCDIKLKNISKIKIKCESRINFTKVIKLTTLEGEQFFSVSSQEHVEWMCRMIWAKLALIGEICNVNDCQMGQMEGQLLKNTFLGWESRYVVISGTTGLKCSKNFKVPPNFFISSVSEIWTRFDLVQKHLVIKMHSLGKHEFAIPIELCMPWLKAFYCLIKK